MNYISKIDYAYVAGLLDADGSYVVAKHRCKTNHNAKRGWVWELRVTIGMAEKAGLNFMMEKFGKKRLRVSKLPSGKEFYHLTLYSGELRNFLPHIVPFAKVKKEQAKILLEAVSIIKLKSDKLVDKRLEEIYLKMKKLNNSRFKPI